MQYDDYDVFLLRQAGTYLEQSTIIPSSIIKIFACANKQDPPKICPDPETTKPRIQSTN